MKKNIYLERLKLIREPIERSIGDYLSSELIPLTIEIIEYSKKFIDIFDLNDRINQGDDIDIKSLEEAADYIDTSSFRKAKRRASGNEIDYSKIHKDLKFLIDGIKSNKASLDPLEIALRLELAADRYFCELIGHPDNPPEVIEKVLEKIGRKILFLSEDETYRIWGLIQKDIAKDPSEDGVLLNTSIVSEDFFSNADLESTRNKITEYIGKFRPRLIYGMSAGQFGIVIPGIAKVLAWKNPQDKPEITDEEFAFFRCLARIIYLWDELSPSKIFIHIHKSNTMPNLLGFSDEIKDKSKLFVGHYTRELEEHVQNNRKIVTKLLILELEIYLQIVNHFEVETISTYEILHRYKLMQEVLDRGERPNIFKKQEVKLQKELCRFLIERGVYACGTSFGSSQTDLVSTDCIVEVKIYGEKPTEKQINKNLTQLECYLGQSNINRKGILVIYNFSDTLIISPRKNFRGQCIILVINLSNKTPSKTEKRIEICENDKGGICFK